MKGDKKDKPDLPETVGDTSGEEPIVDRFRLVYEQLYNSWDTSGEMEELKNEVFGKINNDGAEEAWKVTGAKVKEAAVTMKPGKSDVSESFTNDAILNAPESFFSLLAMVYRSWIIHGTVSLPLLACAFSPFGEGKKGPRKT